MLRPNARRKLTLLAVAVSITSLLLSHSALGTERTPNRFLPGDAEIAPAANDQSAPFIAAGGGVTLAVWSDNRANSTGGYEGETSRDIYGMRFDAVGQPLDATPFPIAANPAAQEFPRVAWNGTHFLVVFESYDVHGAGSYYQKTLEAVRVTPAGVLADAKPIKLVNLLPVGATWAVASNGSEWVIVNQGTSVSSGELVAVRVSANGTLIDLAPKSLLAATYYLRGGLHLAYAGGIYLLAYEESMTGSDPVNALRFDSSLTLLDANPIALNTVPFSRMISNGSQFYAVWVEQLPDFTIAVKGSRISTAGAKLDGTGDVISGSNAPQAYTVTTVAWDGSVWKVSWQAADGARIARVNSSGQVLDPGGQLVAGITAGPTASQGNGTLDFVWIENSGTGSNDLFGAHLDTSSIAGPRRIVSSGAPLQFRPDIALGSSSALIVYRSSTSTRHRVLAQLLDAAGNPLSAEPLELDSAVSINYPGYPAVAWNGSLYFVAWNTSAGVVGKRVAANGTVLDSAPILLMSSAFGPVDVEALGSEFLTVGLRCGINCQWIYPIVVRLRGTDGVVLDSSPIALSGNYSSSPRLVTLGGKWLVAWQDNATHDDCMASTVGQFVQASGQKEPSFTIHGPYSSCGGNGIFGVGLASNGQTAVMVQPQELTSGVENDLLMRRIQANGSVEPYVNLTPWEEDQYRARVAWDGTHFIVVWQDQRTALSVTTPPWRLEQIDARSDVLGMRIRPDGSIVDPAGFVLSNSRYAEAYPNVVAANGVTWFAESLMIQSSPRANYRIAYELLDATSNHWPIANVSAVPSLGDVPLSVSFSSAGSTDLDGSIVQYSWDFGDGATSSALNPSHLYSFAGPFVATLSIRDDDGATSLQQVLVSAVAPNVNPVAVATADKTSGPAPLDVIFSASGSYDPDGWIGNIHWTFSDGGEYWGSPAYHTFYQSGPWSATLTVFDGRGGTGSTTINGQANAPLPPTAPIDLNAQEYSEEWIELSWTDTSNSEDGFKIERCQGTVTTCHPTASGWQQIAVTEANAWYYDDYGLASGTTYSYRLRAFNVSGDSPYSNTDSATTHSLPPVAVNTPSVLNGLAPLIVRFDGSRSHDDNGTITSYAWDFGDGSIGSGPIVTHAYGAVGSYLAVLTVTSSTNETGTSSALITVKPGSSRSLAVSDAATSQGTILSGTYLDTRTQNDLAEVLMEARTSGTPSTRRSVLEHTWQLSIVAGYVQTFYLNAWHSVNSEGDDFLFEYSRNNIDWSAMITVRKTTDDDSLESFTFPSAVTGTIWVRVRDLDRTPGRGQMDTVSIDEMFVAGSPTAAYSGEAGRPNAGLAEGLLMVRKTGFGAELELRWGGSCMASDTDYSVYEGTLGQFASHLPVNCSTGGSTTALITTPATAAYYLVVPNDGYYEGRYGQSSSGNNIPAGPTRCLPPAVSTGCP
jgi:PKD repeat protein